MKKMDRFEDQDVLKREPSSGTLCSTLRLALIYLQTTFIFPLLAHLLVFTAALSS